MLKNQKIVIIGDDGQPQKNADGTFKIVDLYRGSISKDEHTEYLTKKATNLNEKNKDLENKLNEYINKDKTSQIDNLFNELKIDPAFRNILNIDNNLEIKDIKNNLSNLIKDNPKLLISDQNNNSNNPFIKKIDNNSSNENNIANNNGMIIL